VLGRNASPEIRETSKPNLWGETTQKDTTTAQPQNADQPPPLNQPFADLAKFVTDEVAKEEQAQVQPPKTQTAEKPAEKVDEPPKGTTAKPKKPRPDSEYGPGSEGWQKIKGEVDHWKGEADYWKALANKKEAAPSEKTTPAAPPETKTEVKTEVAKTVPAETPELKTLRDKVEYYEKVVRAVALERDPAFQAEFSNRFKNLRSRLHEEAGAEMAGEIEKLVQSTNGVGREFNQGLTQLLGEADEITKSEVLATIRDMRNLSRERQERLAESRGKFVEFQAAEQKKHQENEARMRQGLETDFETELTDWRNEGRAPYLLVKDDVEGAAENNAEVQKRVEYAKRIFLGDEKLTTRDLAKACLEAAAVPGLLKEILSGRTRIAELEKELGALRVAGGKTVTLEGEPPGGTKPEISSWEDLGNAVLRDLEGT